MHAKTSDWEVDLDCAELPLVDNYMTGEEYDEIITFEIIYGGAISLETTVEEYKGYQRGWMDECSNWDMS